MKPQRDVFICAASGGYGGRIVWRIPDTEKGSSVRGCDRRRDGVLERGSDIVVVPHSRHEGLFIVNDQVCTKNMIPGEAVYGETLLPVQNEDGTEVEYRVWDPSRSDLAALILKGVDNIWIKPDSKVLYLGADSFATVSHLSDIVGTSGMVYAVTSSPCTNLSDLASKRTNVKPIIGDPRDPAKYHELVENVDVMLSEVPLDYQVQMMALNASYFLKVGGHFLASIQANSLKSGMPIDSEQVIGFECTRLLVEQLEAYEKVNLERDHAYYVGAYNGPRELNYVV